MTYTVASEADYPLSFMAYLTEGDVGAMGGTPSKGTPKDKRLKENAARTNGRRRAGARKVKARARRR